MLQYGEPLPKHFGAMDCITVDNGVISVATSWGEVRTAPMPSHDGKYTACLTDYGDGSVNLLTLSEPSAKEYIVCDDEGNDIGKLVDLF